MTNAVRNLPRSFQKDAPRVKASAPPVIVESSSDFSRAMRRRRESLGMSGEALDARIGWADRYSAKAENPGTTWGKCIVRFAAMAPFWLAGLNAKLVLMDADQAERLVRDHGQTRRQ